MNSITYKLFELVIIFILVPISFAISYLAWIKLGIGLFGFIYVLYILLKVERLKFKIAKSLNWKLFWRTTFLKFIIIALVTTIFVWVTDAQKLFGVLINQPFKWLVLLFVYSFFSVYPQELIFRTFYFTRYQSLFKNQNLFLLVNALLFALAHLLFGSVLVIVLTFLGGLLFAFTYHKTKSTLLVSIEHAIYGCWLLTVGLGSMLGFPV